MDAFSRRLVTGLAVIAVATLAGCSEQIPAVAERFVAELGQPHGAGLEPWFRAEAPALLRRRCPDCPRDRRLVETFVTVGTPVGASMTTGSEAAMEAEISVLKVGERRCEGDCCEWSVGVLDHAAIHLERACFEQDAAGPYVTLLSLVDG